MFPGIWAGALPVPGTNSNIAPFVNGKLNSQTSCATNLPCFTYRFFHGVSFTESTAIMADVSTLLSAVVGIVSALIFRSKVATSIFLLII